MSHRLPIRGVIVNFQPRTLLTRTFYNKFGNYSRDFEWPYSAANHPLGNDTGSQVARMDIRASGDAIRFI
jgi:hypothetical protein